MEQEEVHVVSVKRKGITSLKVRKNRKYTRHQKMKGKEGALPVTETLSILITVGISVQKKTLLVTSRTETGTNYDR